MQTHDFGAFAALPALELAGIAGGDDGGWLYKVSYAIGYAVGALVTMAETQPPASYTYAKIGY